MAAKPEQTHHTAPDSISPGQHLRTNFLLTDLHPSLRFSFHPSCIAFLLPCYLLICSFISSSFFSFLSLLPLFSTLIHFPLCFSSASLFFWSISVFLSSFLTSSFLFPLFFSVLLDQLSPNRRLSSLGYPLTILVFPSFSSLICF